MQHDLIAKYYAHYYSTTMMLEKNQIFSVLISRKYGNIFINYIGLVPIEIFVLYCRLYLDITRILLWASVFNLYEQASGTLFASDSCKTPKILKATFLTQNQ